MSVATKPIPLMNKAVVPVAQITDYLRSHSHPIGRAKAGFFLGCGFTPEDPQAMIDALIAHAKAQGAYSKPSPYGLKYIVEVPVETPARRPVMVCSVWMIEAGSTAPTFETAYPIRRART